MKVVYSKLILFALQLYKILFGLEVFLTRGKWMDFVKKDTENSIYYYSQGPVCLP